MSTVLDGEDRVLSSEMRAEIERLLRAGGDGLSHGAVFCRREQGLTTEQIAAKRDVSVAENRKWLQSVDQLLAGTIPSEQGSWAFA